MHSAVSVDGGRAAALLPEWRSLYARVGSRSPFNDPDLLLAWAEQHCRHQDVAVVALRDEDGALAGVAPLYRRRLPAGAATSLHVLGSVVEPYLFELTHLLLDPATRRRSLAALVAWLAADEDWDWAVLPLLAEQGWWESRWLVDARLPASAVVPADVTPQVVVDLRSEGALGSRNLRESLRRSRKRLGAGGREWTTTVVRSDEPGWSSAVADLRRLHALRAGMSGTVAHPDVFAGTGQARLLDAVARVGTTTRPAVRRVYVGETSVAALLVLEGSDRTWISVSGVDPQFWDTGAVTFLQWEAVDDARTAGCQEVSFAPGIDTSKLRWSDDVRTSTEFFVVHGRRRSELAFRVMWQVRAWRVLRRRRLDAQAVRPQSSGAAPAGGAQGSRVKHLDASSPSPDDVRGL